MLFWDTIKFASMALRLTPKALNTIDVIMLISKQFTMVDTIVFKLRNIITTPNRQYCLVLLSHE